MSPSGAKLASRSLLGVAVVMVVATGAIAFGAYADAEPGVIAVFPPEDRGTIERAAGNLDDECQGEVADAALGDAPSVYCYLLEERAGGDPLTPSPVSPTALVALLVSLGWLATGGMIASRQPDNLAGWIFQIIGFGLILEFLTVALVFLGVKVNPGSVPFLDVWALVAEFAILVVAFVPLLWLLFPDGRPPTARWRWGLRLYFAAVAFAAVTVFVEPGAINNLVDYGIVYVNPLGVGALSGVAGAATAVGATSAVMIAIATVFAVRSRFKRATGEERQQLRWLRFVTTIAVSLFIVTFVGGSLLEATGASDPTVDLWFPTFFGLMAATIAIGVPAAYLIAIFRHGLWDLDLVIKKTVRFTALFAAMILVAVAVVIGIPLLILGADSGTDFWLVVALATLLAAVFTWLRGPARRLADRIVYGRRATPYEVLTSFSERVGETYSADDVLPRMAAVLGQGTGADRATVWLRVGDRLRPAAVWPDAAEGPTDAPDDAVDVVHQGDHLGALSVDMPADDPLTPVRETLIADLAAQAGLVLRNVRLIEELRASRQRLVAAQDEERRRLERNIHDGVQQQLVALQVQLKLARTMVDRDPAKVGELLESLTGASAETLDDLRDLARGIYPPLLADQGLAAALGAQARKAAIPVTVEPGGIGRYPQEIEATVYFCVLEALNNTAKYAAASGATVSLGRKNGSLVFRVIDDGRGFDPGAGGTGTGLQGMADRLEALGGSLHVDSRPGSGTSVSGLVPLGALP